MFDRFIPENDVVTEVESTFVKLYSLDQDADCTHTVEQAIAHPELYVLKPQREGGGVLCCVRLPLFMHLLACSGNNYYGEQLRSMLQTLSPLVCIVGLTLHSDF
jgi:hypothetical protein